MHLFTGSKIGFPGPRVGFLYSEAELEIADGKKVPLSDLALVESSSELLFHSPGALRGFEALLHEQDGVPAVLRAPEYLALGRGKTRRLPREPANSA